MELWPLAQRLILCWRIRFSHRRHPEQIEVRIDASRQDPPRLLLATSRLRHLHTANVPFPVLGPRPVTLPEPAGRYPLVGGGPPPAVWVSKGRTEGPNVDIDTQSGPKTLMATPGGLGPDTFQAPDADRERLITVFYFTNYAHDFYFRLGFDPAHGSFDSASKDDRLFVRIWKDKISGDATMETPTDGEAPRMDLGPTATGGHTALDPEIILHEYTHAVVARRVGGRGDDSSLEAPQSLAMAEGWCDFFTLTLFSALTGGPRRRLGTAAYGAPGLRDYATAVGHFGSIGHGVFAPGTDALYRIGQIWCATLLDVERRIVALRGEAAGRELCWLLILDSLALLARNPNFLQGRDALRKAVRDKGLPMGVEAEVWAAFASFGMGPAASCVGTTFQPTVPDFNPP